MSIHDFFASICPACLWIFTIVHLFFIILFIFSYIKLEGKKLSYFLCSLISFGLFYDSLILSLGTILPSDSNTLHSLSHFRFISHGALIPLLFAITAINLTLPKYFSLLLLILTGILIILGIAEGIATELKFDSVANVNRYTMDPNLTPTWAKFISYILTYGAVIPLIVGGIYDWIKKKKVYFFLSGFLMMVFSAIGPGIGCVDLIFFISMFGELLMMLFLFLSIYFNNKGCDEKGSDDVDPLLLTNSTNSEKEV